MATFRKSFWLEKADSRAIPLWLRVSALGMGLCGDDGVARFQRGEIARRMGDGEPLDRHSVQRAIRTAVEYGWLKHGSGTTALMPVATAKRDDA